MTNNLQVATKIADQIVKKLFDHRQFTTGEINTLIKDYETSQRLSDNFDKILKIDEDLNSVYYGLNNDLAKLNDDIAQNLLDQLHKCEIKAQNIFEAEEMHKQKNEDSLAKPRQDREVAKQELIKAANQKIEVAEKEFRDNEIKLEQKYRQLEANAESSFNQ